MESGNWTLLHADQREMLALHQTPRRIHAREGLPWWRATRRFAAQTAETSPRARCSDRRREMGVPQVGTADSWGGTLATATGLVFYGEDSGNLVAADATTGKTLWSLHLNANWHASPMVYQFDGRELIGVAVGSSVMVFGLWGQSTKGRTNALQSLPSAEGTVARSRN
jgi:hypothetical protein